jgi:hypothetical protein
MMDDGTTTRSSPNDFDFPVIGFQRLLIRVTDILPALLPRLKVSQRQGWSGPLINPKSGGLVLVAPLEHSVINRHVLGAAARLV